MAKYWESHLKVDAKRVFSDIFERSGLLEIAFIHKNLNRRKIFEVFSSSFLK